MERDVEEVKPRCPHCFGLHTDDRCRPKPGTVSSVKPTIPAVLDRFRAYHRANGAWGSLHVVLDDGNVEDSHVASCVALAEERGDAEGAALGRILLRMSKTQRLKLARTA